jgi:Flp pilus assembly protein TadB
MIAGVLAGCLVVAVLSICRIRPDHRLREGAPAPRAPTARLTATRPRFRRSRRAAPAEIAGWCDALARDVRAGSSLGAALRTIPAPEGTTLVAIPHALARGRSLTEALATGATSPDEHAVLTVLAACAQHGGPAAQPLDQVAATLRRRAADAAERAVHSAQARLSAMVMTVLPGAVLLLLLVTSPAVRRTAGSALGATVVALGLGLNALGWVWMRRIIGGRRR